MAYKCYKWTCYSYHICNEHVHHIIMIVVFIYSSSYILHVRRVDQAETTGSSVNNVPRWTFPLYLLVWIYSYCTIWTNKSPSFFQLHSYTRSIYIHEQSILVGQPSRKPTYLATSLLSTGMELFNGLVNEFCPIVYHTKCKRTQPLAQIPWIVWSGHTPTDVS